jgi:hypothetical protein
MTLLVFSGVAVTALPAFAPTNNLTIINKTESHPDIAVFQKPPAPLNQPKTPPKPSNAPPKQSNHP